MNSIERVFFGTSTIQKSRRVALDPNLLTTLGLQEGDAVTVELDIHTSTILIRKGVLNSSKKDKGSRGMRA